MSVCVHHRNIQKVAIEMFKVKNNLCPAIFRNIFSVNTNSRSNAYFHRPNVNKVYKGEHSIRYFGPLVWDTMVPERLKTISIYDEFKREITKWVPDNCLCRICKEYVSNLGFVALYE